MGPVPSLLISSIPSQGPYNPHESICHLQTVCELRGGGLFGSAPHSASKGKANCYVYEESMRFQNIQVIYMGFDQNSFIRERPFFAYKNFTFAKLPRTPCLSFAGPMLANNTSYEDSFTTCQITPENHGSLLDSLLNMQQASRSPFSGQIVAD